MANFGEDVLPPPGQAKRGRGRPPKQRPVEGEPEPRKLDAEPRMVAVEPEPRKAAGQAKSTPPSPSPSPAVMAIAAKLTVNDWAKFGFNERALVEVLVDVSPSEAKFLPEAIKAFGGLTDLFQGSSVARSRVDTMIFAGDHRCELLGFEHGKLTLPEVLNVGSGTVGCPWLDGMEAGVVAWRDQLAGRGIRRTEGLSLVCSDFRFADQVALVEALGSWRRRMEDDLGQVVVAAGFGDIDFETAATFTDLPVVDLRTIPVAALFTRLGGSISDSFAQPGRLKLLLKAEIEKLTKGD